MPPFRRATRAWQSIDLVKMGGDSLKIALLSYRGHPHVGGQGVYVHYLSDALGRLGHDVTVFSGPPYPELSDRVKFVSVPSLDLYRPEDPFRRPVRSEFKDAVDVLEYALMCTAAFPEPLTFSLRIARLLRDRGAFDIVHDNQCLGYGLLALMKRGFPVVATVHHPIPVDRRLDLARAKTWSRKLSLRRWYSFTKMQARVASRLSRITTVSNFARNEVSRELQIPIPNIGVVHNGVDPDLFRPLDEVFRCPGRVVAVASSDMAMKGLDTLLESIAKLSTERDIELVIIGKGGSSVTTKAAIRRFGIKDRVRAEGRIDVLRVIEEFARAEVAIVPSLYEGFSLPAVEAMSCGLPLVTTTGGALPEVVGPDGKAALLVPPGDAGAMASAIAWLLDDRNLRLKLGETGRARAVEHFSWEAAARATVDQYRLAAEC